VHVGQQGAQHGSGFLQHGSAFLQLGVSFKLKHTSPTS